MREKSPSRPLTSHQWFIKKENSLSFFRTPLKSFSSVGENIGIFFFFKCQTRFWVSAITMETTHCHFPGEIFYRGGFPLPYTKESDYSRWEHINTNIISNVVIVLLSERKMNFGFLFIMWYSYNRIETHSFFAYY